jgi:hypothetical protein
VHYYFGMAASANIRVHMDKIKLPHPLVIGGAVHLTGKGALLDRSYVWCIVLTNVGSSPARQVRYVLEPASGVYGDELEASKKEIPLLPGNGARERIDVWPKRGTAERISLKLSWSDDQGGKEQYFEIEIDHDNRALRIT